MNKTFKTLVGVGAVALTVGLVGCTTPKQNPQNVANLSQSEYTTGKISWYKEHTYKLPSIHFAYNSAVIDSSWNQELNTLATGLKSHPHGMALLVGYTDSNGSASYNKQLSVQRSKAVKAYLVQQGVNPKQVRIAGAGEKNPIEANGSTVGEHFNRRVDIYVMPMADKAQMKALKKQAAAAQAAAPAQS